MRILFISLCLISILSACNSNNPKQDNESKSENQYENPNAEKIIKDIKAFCEQYKAKVGFAVIHPTLKDTLQYNGNEHLPMQSVFKFHIVAALLEQIDQGKFSLDQNIVFKESDLLENTWSPLNEKYNPGDSTTISEIMNYTVSQSDNNGCDIILRLLGDPPAVQQFINNIGVQNFAIETNEEEMHRDSSAQFKNWTTPIAACQALIRLYQNEPQVLSIESYRFLWAAMENTNTGPNRIKGKLPNGTRVAHKTGTSGTNSVGITEATNDIGVVFLPDGTPIIIAAMVAASQESDTTNEHIIATLSKMIWDHYTINQNK